MLQPLARGARLLLPLSLALAATVAYVPMRSQRPSATTPATAPPGDRQGGETLTFSRFRQTDNSTRKSDVPQSSTSPLRPAQLPGLPSEEEDDDSTFSRHGFEEEEGEDPDLPGFLRGRVKIDKEEYLRQRAEHIAMMRGFGEDPLHVKRSEALRQMERQARRKGEFTENLLAGSSTWKSIGPAPIPNGQTTNRSDPVSGRTISIAIHPTNPNIVYVGTAQGGLYRSLDGGATWTPLMDEAQSLAIGALALAPSDPSILYVGTGENGMSADSYFGVGLYRIDNADTTATLTGPINPTVATGVSGTTAFTGRAVSRILVHPTDPATIFVATAAGTSSNPSNLGYTTTPPLAIRGVYRSTNATSPSPTFTKLTVTSANSVAPDNTGDRDIMDLAMEPGNPNVVLAWVGGTSPFTAPSDSATGVYRTTNALGAANFTRTFTSTVAGARGEFAINKIGGTVNVVVATGETAGGTLCTIGNGAVRTSSDGGATWSEKRPGGGGFCAGQCFYDIAVAIHPTDPNIILLGGSAPANCSFDFARSTDGAATNFLRTNTGLHADTHVIAISPSNPNVVYIGNDGGIWKSTDTGQTWTSLNNSGFNATQFQDMALHPLDREFMLGGTQDNGTLFKQPGGAWRRADFGDGGHTLIDQSATDTTDVTIYHTYANLSNGLIGFARITNSGCASEGQWSFRGTLLFSTDNTPNCPLTPSEPGLKYNLIGFGDAVRFYPPMALGPGTPNSVYFGTDKLYRDGEARGDFMFAVSQDLGDAGNAITSIGVSRLNDSVRVIGTFDGKVFATTTGANPMTDVTDAAEFPALIFGTRRAVTDIAIDPNNSNVVYVAFGGYEVASGRHVFKTTDLNATLSNPALWTPAGNGIPDVPVDSLVIDPADSNVLYAGTDIGVYISTDAGASWTPFSTGLPRVPVFDLEIQPAYRILRAVTHGRGMWEIKLPGTLPGISDIPDLVTKAGTPYARPFAVSSDADNADALVLTATLANPSLASVSFGGTGNNRTLLITPGNQPGNTDVTVTVTEGGRSVSDSFKLTVKPDSPVNHAPVLDLTARMSLNPVSQGSTGSGNPGTTVTEIIASAGGDRITDADPDALEGIAVFGVDNNFGTWQYTLDGGTTWLPLDAPSDVTARLLAATPSTRVRFLPDSGFVGTVDTGMAFRAWDQTSGTNGNTANVTTAGGSTAFSLESASASVTVRPTNHAPAANAQSASTGEDAPVTITLSGADPDDDNLSFSVVSAPARGTLGGFSTPVRSGATTTTKVVYTPLANLNGGDSFTFRVHDGSTFSDTATVSIMVNAVPDPPTNTVPASQSTAENTPLVFSSPNSNLISVADVDAGSNPLRVTLTATNGTTTLSGTGGLSVAGNGTTKVTASGKIPDLNTALDGMRFSPNQGYAGAASLQIVTDDQGVTGGGVSLSDDDTININVLEGGALSFSAATYTAAEGMGTATITVNRALGSAGEARVNYTTSDGSAAGGKDYTASSGTLVFSNGVTTRTFTIPLVDDALNEAPETVNLTLYDASGSGALGATAAAVLTITDNDAPVFQFNTPLYSVNEGSLYVAIQVTRSGDVSQPASVKYQTSDTTDVNFRCDPKTAGQVVGVASRKCDYHIAVGRLRFAAGETSKQILVSVVDDAYAEGAETFTVSLSDATGLPLGQNAMATITITDNDAPGQSNPIDSTRYYVRQLYVDLLSREPDQAGWDGWTNRIDLCGQPGQAPPPCDRVTVGGDGFLRSSEFFDRQFFVLRLYRTAFGRILQYGEVGDLAFVSGFLSPADLEFNKQELVAELMARPEFKTKYDGLGDALFVDTLLQTAQVTVPRPDRDAWVLALGANTRTQAQVFREISERPEVSAKYLTEAQVVSAYYGFFTRNPDGAYLNYLQRLNSGEINLADLANAFINAQEYRLRFGR